MLISLAFLSQTESRCSALDSTASLSSLPNGFVSITHPAFESLEFVSLVKAFNLNGVYYLTTDPIVTLERVVYKVKFSGGGSLTTRIVNK